MARSLSTEDLYNTVVPTAVAVAPSGDRIAFVVREVDPDENAFVTSLCVVPSDGGEPPHRLTRVPGADAPTWSPDGTKLAFLAARDRDVTRRIGRDRADEDADGDDETGDTSANDDEPKQQLWVFDLARGGDAYQVTAFEEGVRGFDWAPDGRRFVVAAREPTEEQREYLAGIREETQPYEVTRLQHKRDGQGFLDDVRTYLFVVEDAEGTTPEAAVRLDDAYGRGAFESALGLQPAWGPTDRIAFASYFGDEPDGTYALDAHTIAPDGGDRRAFTDGDVTVVGLEWSPDGAQLAFGARHSTNFYRPGQIHVIDPTTDERRVVSGQLEPHLWTGLTWLDDETLLAAIADEGCTRLAQLVATGEDPRHVFSAQGDGRTITQFDATATTTAMVVSHPTAGVDVHAMATDDLPGATDATRLTALNDDLFEEAALPTCERIRFENADDLEVEGLVYFPDGIDPASVADPLPLICQIHGGPTAYDAPGFRFDVAYWTGQGYAVLNVNYRGSTSYGAAFCESIRGEWGPRETDDILSGVDAVVERGWADPDRLFITGFSQGGINSLYVVTRDDRFAAAAPEHGIYDFVANFGTADMHQWYVNDLGVPWENAADYRAISSIQDVDRIATPLLITAGEHDWRCPPSQAEQLYVSAKRAGVDAKLVIYQDEHHNLSRPDRAIHRIETLTAWFDDHDPGASPA